MIDPQLLAVLVCPLTRGPLVYDDDTQELISPDAWIAFPVINGVPSLIVEDARMLTFT